MNEVKNKWAKKEWINEWTDEHWSFSASPNHTKALQGRGKACPLLCLPAFSWHDPHMEQLNRGANIWEPEPCYTHGPEPNPEAQEMYVALQFPLVCARASLLNTAVIRPELAMAKWPRTGSGQGARGKAWPCPGCPHALKWESWLCHLPKEIPWGQMCCRSRGGWENSGGAPLCSPFSPISFGSWEVWAGLLWSGKKNPKLGI